MSIEIKKSTNPCHMKGRYGGKKNGGWRTYSIHGVRLDPSGCECNRPFILHGARGGEDTNRPYAMDSIGGIRPSLKAKAEGFVQVVPCKESFLPPSSTGTRAYKAAKAKTTKFRGCHALEQMLLDNYLIDYEPAPYLGTEHLLGDAPRPDEPDYGPEVDHIVVSQEEKSAFYLEAHKEFWKLEQERVRFPTQESVTESLWDVVSFENQKLELLRNLVDRVKLTFKQREAISNVYLENDRGKSIPEIAKRMKIKPESLKSRLELALTKIRAIAPNYSYPKRKRDATTAKYWKAPDLQDDGFYRRSEAKRKHPIRFLNPKSKEVEETVDAEMFAKDAGLRRERRHVDKEKIKKWASDSWRT